MKKSELRQIIRNEIRLLREGGPSQQQIKRAQSASKLFDIAEKAYKEFLGAYGQFQASIKGKPTPKQVADIRKAYAVAKKHIDVYIATDSEAMYVANSASNKLVSNWARVKKELGSVIR